MPASPATPPSPCPRAAYVAGLLPADNVEVMGIATEFFATRLVKKECRTPDPLGDPGSDLCRCIGEFRGIVRDALRRSVEGSPQDTDEWEVRCDAFTEKWAEMCHWCCPVRLGEYLEQYFPIHWSGAAKERRKPPPREKRAGKKEADRAPAQQHWCAHCGVMLNSAAQTLIHVQGQRHKGQVALLARECALRRVPFRAKAPQPVEQPSLPVAQLAVPVAAPVAPAPAPPAPGLATPPRRAALPPRSAALPPWAALLLPTAPAVPPPAAIPLRSANACAGSQQASSNCGSSDSIPLSDSDSVPSASEDADDCPPALLCDE